jgi:hypothetical protein
MDDLFKSKETAQAAADAIPALQEAKDAVTAGMFTGAGADWKLKGAKVINALGGNVRPEEIANTEIFGAQMGRQVLGLVKNLGAGSGISNADRDYAAMVAGGNISLDEKSILRLIDIGDRAAKASVIAHNSKAERVMAQPEAKGIPYDLTVKAPAISDPFPKQQVGQFEEGQTARNPQTGQVIIYRNGQWVSK